MEIYEGNIIKQRQMAGIIQDLTELSYEEKENASATIYHDRRILPDLLSPNVRLAPIYDYF
jgi:hypothetical protein